jgi:hypothetical protein
MATQHDINVKQNANFELNVAAKNSDGTVMDLNGYSGKMQVRENAADPDVLMEASTANSRITINVTTGVVSVLVPADITNVMTWDSGVYDLFVFTTTANRKCLAEGNASFSRAVTQ